MSKKGSNPPPPLPPEERPKAPPGPPLLPGESFSIPPSGKLSIEIVSDQEYYNRINNMPLESKTDFAKALLLSANCNDNLLMEFIVSVIDDLEEARLNV